jgi:eukaryotic-like serine/threonine-protein kinase
LVIIRYLPCPRNLKIMQNPCPQRQGFCFNIKRRYQNIIHVHTISMRKYQLSQQFRLTNAQNTEGTLSANEDAFYGLIDTASDECIALNSTMYLFLKQYETPKTLAEIAQFFAESFDATAKEVLPIVRSFFNEMQDKGVIVAPKMVENSEIIAPHAVGTVVDSYRIEENLSVNLPLEVYKATDLKTGEYVILKMLRLPRRLSQKQLERAREKFREEFDIQKILRGCPTICQLLDLTPDYAVLEWFDSTSLRRRLAEPQGIDASLRDNLLTQILDSYAFMHKKNILHGDVHARNILLSDDNQIKIIDFDLAHSLTNQANFPPVGGGAPAFIPPENVQFDAFNIVKGTANYQTEVYQLGIIAYWMTYGKVPFSGETWAILGHHILNAPIDFPTVNSLGDKILLGTRLFLKKSLSRCPQNRFPSAREMREAFAVTLLENNLLVSI